VTDERVTRGGERRVRVEVRPAPDSDPAARAERTPHLAHGAPTVGEELQAVMAGDDVEPAVIDREVLRVALDVGDRRGAVLDGLGAGDREHRRPHVDAGDQTLAPGAARGPAGDDPGSAGDVENAGARVDPDHIEQAFPDLLPLFDGVAPKLAAPR